jgi:hypothetical protein
MQASEPTKAQDQDFDAELAKKYPAAAEAWMLAEKRLNAQKLAIEIQSIDGR